MNGSRDDWFNDGVAISPQFSRGSRDSIIWSTEHFQAGWNSGLVRFVPSAEYLLALKLKAFRVMDLIRSVK